MGVVGCNHCLSLPTAHIHPEFLPFGLSCNFVLLVTSLLSLVSGKSLAWTPGSRVILASDGSCFSAKKLFKNLLCATRPTPNSRQTKTNRKDDVSFI